MLISDLFDCIFNLVHAVLFFKRSHFVRKGDFLVLLIIKPVYVLYKDRYAEKSLFRKVLIP